MITPGIDGSLAAGNTYQKGGEAHTWLECSLKDARQKRIPWIIVGMHKTFISAIEKTNEVGEVSYSFAFLRFLTCFLGHDGVAFLVWSRYRPAST